MCIGDEIVLCYFFCPCFDVSHVFNSPLLVGLPVETVRAEMSPVFFRASANIQTLFVPVDYLVFLDSPLVAFGVAVVSGLQLLSILCGIRL